MSVPEGANKKARRKLRMKGLKKRLIVLIGCFILFVEIGFGSSQVKVNAEEVSRSTSVGLKDGYLQEDDAFNFIRFIFNDTTLQVFL